MILTVDGHVATIRLNRPETHHRIEPADLDLLATHLRQIHDQREIRVLILASSGKTFSAGFDLGSIGPGGPQSFEAAVDELAACRVPTIAAIQGNVYGGAADLALACDFRIGVEGMELTIPAVRLGIPFYASGTERFLQRVSPNAAKRILLLCEKLDAPALLESGYLDTLVPRQSLEETAGALASKLQSLPPLALQAMKAQLHQFDRSSSAEALRACLASEDHKEAVSAWIEKRQPYVRGM